MVTKWTLTTSASSALKWSSTKAGKIDAIKVERVRDPTQNKRITEMWFAKQWDGLLVALRQVEKDGKEYNIMLLDGTVDGKTVKGK
jgi:hypothetical protein